MEFSAYSSSNLSEDSRHGINIAGPDYSADAVKIKAHCDNARVNNMSVILTLKPVDNIFFQSFFGWSPPAPGAHFKCTQLITQLYEETKKRGTEEERTRAAEITAKIRTYDYSVLEQLIADYLVQFLDYTVHAISLMEEPRVWIELENYYYNNCVHYLREFIAKHRKNWRLMVYQPSHALDALCSDHLAVKYAYTRLISVFPLDMYAFGLPYELNPAMSRRSMTEKLHFLYSNPACGEMNFRKLFNFCPVLRLQTSAAGDQQMIERIVLHDLLVCAISQIKHVFVWTFDWKPDKCPDKRNYEMQKEAYYRAIRTINKKNPEYRDKSLFEMCNSFFRFEKKFLPSGLYEAKFHNLFAVYKFTVNSTENKIEDVDPYDFKIELKDRHGEAPAADEYLYYCFMPVMIMLFFVSLPFFVYFLTHEKSIRHGEDRTTNMPDAFFHGLF